MDYTLLGGLTASYQTNWSKKNQWSHYISIHSTRKWWVVLWLVVCFWWSYLGQLLEWPGKSLIWVRHNLENMLYIDDIAKWCYGMDKVFEISYSCAIPKMKGHQCTILLVSLLLAGINCWTTGRPEAEMRCLNVHGTSHQLPELQRRYMSSPIVLRVYNVYIGKV